MRMASGIGGLLSITPFCGVIPRVCTSTYAHTKRCPYLSRFNRPPPTPSYPINSPGETHPAQNPVQVCIDAVVNSGPREDSTRIGRAGTVRRQACDVSPLRRVNQAIWLLTTGAREASFRSIKSMPECLADELINAAKGSPNSYAIRKKDELERVAKSNR